MTKPELLSTPEAAEYIGVSPHTLEVWRSAGRYDLPYLKVGKLVRYRRPVLDAWLASRAVQP